MKKPIIGVSANILIEHQGTFPGMKRTYVNQDYIACVQQAGGIPLIIPVDNDPETISEALQQMDGLILTGGYDIDPMLYQEEPILQLGFVYKEVDTYYMELLKQAKSKHIPVLGICKGIQAMNVAFHGSLYQDIHTQRDQVLKHDQGTPIQALSHHVTIQPNTFLSTLFQEQLLVNSYHHQAVKDVAPGFQIAAVAQDGVIEAIECMDDGFMLGIQWHPEMLASHGSQEMKVLFEAFIHIAEQSSKH